MSDKFELPSKGFVFWPIGCGDSTTIVVKENAIVVQIDLHHMQKADDGDDPAWPIIDELVRLLPKKNGKPYLSVFMLTHPDQDHILGFAELLKKVTIGEICTLLAFSGIMTMKFLYVKTQRYLGKKPIEGAKQLSTIQQT